MSKIRIYLRENDSSNYILECFILFVSFAVPTIISGNPNAPVIIYYILGTDFHLSRISENFSLFVFFLLFNAL